MKNLFVIGLVCLAATACKKTIDKQDEPLQVAEKIRCDFGLTQFNLTTRPPVNEEIPGSANEPSLSSRSLTSNDGVILLDFDGQVVTGTAWNSVGPINAAPANLTADQIAIIFQRVSNDYSPFNIVVTTNEADYNAANINKRTRVIITETWQWYGLAGGTAVLNSFTTGTNTPCFVFSSLLGYNIKNISEAVSHEAGHTLGLRHQSVYNSSCVKTSEYNSGQGSGETSWAPIMGNAYYKNLSLWHKGPNSLGCNSIQDDVAKIVSVVGNKTDDYPNSPTGAPLLTTTLSGIINDSSDVDFFAVNSSTEKKVYITPFNVGINDAGANVDLIAKVYDSQGNLVSTNEYPGVLFSETSVPSGNYYISVTTIPNLYTSRYGMLGKYSIGIY